MLPTFCFPLFNCTPIFTLDTSKRFSYEKKTLDIASILPIEYTFHFIHSMVLQPPSLEAAQEIMLYLGNVVFFLYFFSRSVGNICQEDT